MYIAARFLVVVGLLIESMTMRITTFKEGKISGDIAIAGSHRGNAGRTGSHQWQTKLNGTLSIKERRVQPSF